MNSKKEDTIVTDNMNRFNIRVYGVLLNENNELLLSKESYKKKLFTKFPGGGLCLGESLPNGLMREFEEECDLTVSVIKLLYVTDTLVPSAFDDSQVIGVYYLVEAKSNDLKEIRMSNVDVENNSTQSFFWFNWKNMPDDKLDFPMDQQAWTAIKPILESL